MSWLQSIDRAILLFLQSLRNPAVDPILTVFSILGNVGIIWIVTALVLLCFRKTRLEGMQLALCLIASLIINNLILKNWVARPRPFHEIEGLRLMLEAGLADVGSWSFPSGHAGASFAAAYSLTRSFGKKGAWAYLAAALIAFSRIYIAAHYPTDILGGIITGTLGAVLAVAAFRAAEKAIRGKKGSHTGEP